MKDVLEISFKKKILIQMKYCSYYVQIELQFELFVAYIRN